MKARGKREACRPWFIQYASFRPEGPKYLRRYYAPSESVALLVIATVTVTLAMFHVQAGVFQAALVAVTELTD